MRAPFGDPLDEDQEPDPEAQRAALDAIMAPAPAPAIAPVKPSGYGSDDAGALAQAQRRDAKERASDDTSAAIYATFARKPMPARHDTQDAANLLERRKGADQEEALAGRQAAMAKNAERADPASQSSQMARTLLKKALPDVAAQIGPQFDRLSHAQVMESFPFMKEIIDTQNKRRAASKLETSPAELEAQRAEAHRLFQGTDFSQMGPEAIKNFMTANGQAAGRQSADKRAEEHAALTRMLAEARANHDKQMEAALTQRLGMMGEKLGLAKSKLAVPGFAPDDLNNPAGVSPEQKNKLTDATTARDMLHSQAEELRNLLAKNGGRLLPGTTDEARASALWAAMDPQITITGGLGGFTEGHRSVTHDIKGGDLTSLRNLLNTDRVPAMLEGVVREADEGVTQRAHANRVHQMAPGETTPHPHFGQSVPGEPVTSLDQGGGGDIVMVLPPGGSKPVPVHRAKLREALAAGGKQVPGG